MKKLIILLCAASATFPAFSRVAIYEGKPISVILPAQHDVVLRFNEPQRVGTRGGDKGELNIRPAGNYVTLTASSAFGVQELIFQGMNTGKVVYTRVNGVLENVPFDDEVNIRFLSDVEKEKNDQESSQHSPSSSLTPPEVVESVARSIAQSYGATASIEDALVAVTKVPTTYKHTPIVGLYRKPDIAVTPIDSFSGGGIYGTSFIFENTGIAPCEIDPMKFRGRWLALDIAKGDVIVRPGRKALIVLFHSAALPEHISDVVYGELR